MKKIIYIFMSLAALFSVAGCDDFLDKQPQSSVTPSSYFKAEADLAAYSINLYAFTSIGPGSYGISTFGSDNGTDNQAAVDYSFLGSRRVEGVGHLGSVELLSDKALQLFSGAGAA